MCPRSTSIRPPPAGPLLFPPEDPADANLFEYKAFSDEEYQAYAELFSDVINV